MSAIQFTQENGIAQITLNRPDAYNSVNKALGKEWITALDQCAEDSSIRVVVITGDGKAFCAGQDLKEIVQPEKDFEFSELLEERYTPIVEKILGLEKPVIAAVNGVAAGAGANLALACDIIVASEKASFIQAFSGIGLIPDSGGTYFLPRLVGRARAMAYAMLGDKISAAKAEEIGMIYRCIPAEEFEAEVAKLASKMAKMPTRALALTKRAINASMGNTFEVHMPYENQLQLEASATEDYQEGVEAFVEKRKPEFKGK
ncbi:MAG: enoyl-CoA hydratase-related protein [Bacteroidota bacterium]